jgi:hypothetical protein
LIQKPVPPSGSFRWAMACPANTTDCPTIARVYRTEGSWHHEKVFEDAKVRALVIPQSCSFAARR